MEFVLNKLGETLKIEEIANVHFFEFQKEYFTKNDKHPFCELVFVSSGTLNVSSEDFCGELKKGEMIIHAENKYHSLSCGNNAPNVIIIGFKCNEKYLKPFFTNPVLLSDKNISKLSEIVKEGRNVFLPPYNKPTYNMKKKNKQTFASEQMLKILLEYFLLGIIREYTFNDKTVQNNSARFSTKEIVEYLNQNFLEKITIDELAFLFGTNRSTLCKEFKLATKKSISKYINDKKLETAIHLIKNTDKSFSQIALELRFDMQNHFTRFFINYTGKTPREYRRLFGK